jgi:hypothetical protein
MKNWFSEKMWQSKEAREPKAESWAKALGGAPK